MIRHLVLVFFFLVSIVGVIAQGLYTARGYWEESQKPEYTKIKQKVLQGDSLSNDEKTYLADFEKYLAAYYQRLSDDEKSRYSQNKAVWDREAVTPAVTHASAEEFEWRGRDRLSQALYGLYYGGSIVAIGEIDGAAAAGIPLITGGLWMLGPALNPKKYEGITRNTVRASNTGKLLGLIYGGSLGIMLAGTSSSDNAKLAWGLSTVGSIALGEIGFHMEKKFKPSAGHIELIRHYGIIGPWVGAAIAASTGTDNSNVLGASLLAGGIGGVLLGNSQAKKYDYSRGDVDAISSLSLIATGIGFTAVAESMNNGNASSSLILIPAAFTIGATAIGQHSVKGAHLTDKQGSTLELSTAGAGLVGLGVAALTESSSPAVWVGIPSGLALITHQILFNNFKTKNLTVGFHGGRHRKNNFLVSLKVTPEGYFINKRMPVKDYSPQTFSTIHQSLVRLQVKF